MLEFPSMTSRNVEIWARRKRGEMEKDLAAEFGLTSSRVWQIFHRIESTTSDEDTSLYHRQQGSSQVAVWTPEMQDTEFRLFTSEIAGFTQGD